MPNPRGSTGYGQKFIDEINGDWGGKPYEDILAVADYVARQPYVNADKMAAAGASYGGYMIDWILGHTSRFKALVSHAGVYDCVASSARPRSCGSRSGSSTARPGKPRAYASPRRPAPMPRPSARPLWSPAANWISASPTARDSNSSLRSSSRRSRPSYWCFPTRATGSASRKIPPCGTTPFWTG